MAFIDDILGGVSRLSIGEPGKAPIIVDASVSETHSVQGEVSDHPVESGVDIVDHYRVLPRAIQIEAVITNSPLVTVSPGGTLISSVRGALDGDVDPSSVAWEELNRFFNEAVVVTITTSLQPEYKNMVLTALDVTRNSGTAGGLFFTVSAREILFVDTQQGEAVTVPVPAVTVGQKKQSAGKSTNTTANAPQADIASSAFKLAGFDPGSGT